MNKISIIIQDFFAQRSKSIPQKQTEVKDLLKAKKVGLFFCVHSGAELNLVRKVVREIKKTFNEPQVILYNTKREIPDVIAERNFFLFGPEDFNMFWNKREDLQHWFDSNTFDLLINFDGADDPIRNAIFSEIGAHFKIGPFVKEREDMYNMMIASKKKKDDYHDYFQQLLHYLTVLNIK